ncbi:MAG: anti-virulence regulator CigR family protein [Gammaproteobacteria bacterium]
MRNIGPPRLLLATLSAAWLASVDVAAKPPDTGNEGQSGKPAKARTHTPPGQARKAEQGVPTVRDGATPMRGADYWQREWDIGDFVAAGFGAVALRELLGEDRSALHIGAEPLPPGIRRNLARGKPLPPGIAKHRPGSVLSAALPRIEGHDWLVVGRNLVLVTVGTLIVREILDNVLD